MINYIGDKDDLTYFFTKFNHLIAPLKFVSFDLDGTLIGDGLDFPDNTLRHLSQRRKTILCTGAGLSSAINKIALNNHTKKVNLSSYFSHSIVVNEGSQIFPSKNAQNSQPIYQKTLTSKEVSRIADLARSLQQSDFDFLSFYPPIINGQHRHYVAFTNKPKTKYTLAKKYGKITIKKSIKEFIGELKELKATKFVIGNFIHKPTNNIDNYLNCVINEGCCNITSAGVNKLSGVTKSLSLLGNTQNRDTLMHFGNDANDLALLKYCRISIIVNTNQQQTNQLLDRINTSSQSHLLVITPNLVTETITLLC